KRRGSVPFTSRKNLSRKRFWEHVNSRPSNSVPGLSTVAAAHFRVHRSKQWEILDLLIQLNRPADPGMRLNPTKRLPAAHTQRTDLFWIRVKAKSRSISKMHRSRSTRCASC